MNGLETADAPRGPVHARLRAVRRALFPAGTRRFEAWLRSRAFVESLLKSLHCGATRDLDRRWAHSAAAYRRWWATHAPGAEAAAAWARRAEALRRRPLVSVLTPVRDVPREAFLAAWRSMREQVYTEWEWVLVDDASSAPHVAPLLAEVGAADRRVRVDRLARHSGIVGASACALELARGEFVALLDQDDALEPDALLAVVEALLADDATDVVYTDEDVVLPDGTPSRHAFKPDWSPRLLLSCNYITHLAVMRRSVVVAAGGFRPGYDGAQDYDLLLRTTEIARRVAHVPRVLYHWRMVPGSTAASPGAKPAAHDAGRRAIEDALRRRGIDGRVESGRSYRYVVRRRLAERPLVSIVIPTRNRTDLLAACLASVRSRTDYAPYEIVVVDDGSDDADAVARVARAAGPCRIVRRDAPFNFSEVCNAGAAAAEGAHLVFLNNDTEVLVPAWLDALVEVAADRDVGAVGAKLLYPGGRIQHAGITVGAGGAAVNAFRLVPDDGTSYQWLADSIRECSAVTAACMLVPRPAFDRVDGFDPALRVAFGDVDLCLRLRKLGLHVVYTPCARLRHAESATRGSLHPPEDDALFRARWAAEIAAGDPFYNRNLSLDHTDWRLGDQAAR